MKHARVIKTNTKPPKRRRGTVAELYRLYRWYRFNKYTRREALQKAWRNWK